MLGKYMRFIFSAMVLGALALPVMGQATTPGPQFDTTRYQQRISQLLQQMQSGQMDTATMMQQFATLRQQFQQDTANMDPAHQQQLQQQMMQQMMPMIQ